MLLNAETEHKTRERMSRTLLDAIVRTVFSRSKVAFRHDNDSHSGHKKEEKRIEGFSRKQKLKRVKKKKKMQD